VVKFAIGHDYLEKDPFLLYKAKSVRKEVVSELLGHTKLATTQQSYGKIVQKKVTEEMRKLN
jgi:integrase